MTSILTAENYQSAYYTNRDLVVFIATGAELSGEQIFLATSHDSQKQQDLFQQEFSSLEEALEFVNLRFAKWALHDSNTATRASGGGCGCSSGGCGS